MEEAFNEVIADDFFSIEDLKNNLGSTNQILLQRYHAIREEVKSALIEAAELRDEVQQRLIRTEHLRSITKSNTEHLGEMNALVALLRDFVSSANQVIVEYEQMLECPRGGD